MALVACIFTSLFATPVFAGVQDDLVVTASIDASTPGARIVTDGDIDVFAAAYRFSSKRSCTIKELSFKIPDGSGIDSMDITDEKDVIIASGGVNVGANTSFIKLCIPLSANKAKVLRVHYNMGTVGPGEGKTGAAIQPTLVAGRVAIGKNIQEIKVLNCTGNALYSYAAVPEFKKLPSSSSLVAGQNTDALKFTISSIGGPISWKVITFTIDKVAGKGKIAICDGTKLYADGVQIKGQIIRSYLKDTDASGRITFIADQEQKIGKPDGFIEAKTYSLCLILKADNGIAYADFLSVRNCDNAFKASSSYGAVSSPKVS